MEEGDTTGAAMRIGSDECAEQVVLAGDVADRILDEDRIEGASQAHAAHIALEVLQIRVNLLAGCQHIRREIDQGHAEVALEVRGVIATARAQLEDVAAIRDAGTIARWHGRRQLLRHTHPGG